MKDAKSLLRKVLKELEHWRKNYPGGDQTGPRRDISHELEYEIKTYLKSEPLIVDFEQLRPSGYSEAPGGSAGGYGPGEGPAGVAGPRGEDGVDFYGRQEAGKGGMSHELPKQDSEEVKLLRRILAALEKR